MGNVELLQAVYEQWSRGNFRPVTDVYGADLEWGWSDEFFDLAGVERDSGDRSERLLRWFSSWEVWRVEAEEYLTAGDQVVVLTRYIGTGKGSGGFRIAAIFSRRWAGLPVPVRTTSTPGVWRQ